MMITASLMTIGKPRRGALAGPSRLKAGKADYFTRVIL